MDDILNTFIAKYTGASGVGDTPENISQCVGLISVWLDNLGLNTPHLYGNAKDLLTNADPSKFDIIQNTPTNVPVAGDVIVWGDTWGNGFGHTAIFCSGDANSFNCIEQNDPDGSSPHAKVYSYDGVIGWLHPKNVDTDPLVCDPKSVRDELVGKASHYDEFVAAGFNNVSDIQTKIKNLQSTVDNLNQTVNDRNQDIAKLNGELGTQKEQLTAKQQSIDSLTPLAKQVPVLQGQITHLQEQLDQAKNDRTVCLQAQETQNKTIGQLRLQVAQKVPTGFWNRVLFLLNK